MTTTIRQVAAALAKLEEGIRITDPVVSQAKAFPFLPSGSDTLPLPCWMNTYFFESQIIRANGARQLNYTAYPQLFVSPTLTSPAHAADITMAFHDAALEAFAANVQLDMQGVTVQNLRGSQARTIGNFDWGGLSYLGLDYQVDILIYDVLTAGP